MAEFKPISREAIPLALEKAERYRLLNEPAQAESICLDILAVEPEHQAALVMLLLSLTDQFRRGPAECFRQAEAVLPRLRDEYERLYYGGLIRERRGLAQALHGGPGSAAAAYAWVRQAMDLYAKAERLRPPGNDDPLLRWNSCLRLCERHHLRPAEGEVLPHGVGDE